MGLCNLATVNLVTDTSCYTTTQGRDMLSTWFPSMKYKSEVTTSSVYHSPYMSNLESCFRYTVPPACAIHYCTQFGNTSNKKCHPVTQSEQLSIAKYIKQYSIIRIKIHSRNFHRQMSCDT